MRCGTLSASHGVFHRGARAVIFALGLVRRNEIGDVAHDEQRAGLGIEDRRHIDTRVAAGDHHGGRRLPELSELKIAAAILGMHVAAEAEMPVDQSFSVNAIENPH